MKQLLRKGLAFFIAVAFTAIAWAQDRTVTGKVSATEDGGGLPGVSVLAKGTSIGTTTDANGNYKLNIPSNATKLVFSYVGFLTKEVEIGSRTSIDVSLDTDVRLLNEVVVTGYGVQDKRELTGAVSSVKGSTIQNLPMQSFDRALQGRAAGVQVLSANGAPGGQVQVRIRGIGSISAGNEPLYIVDGVQLNNRNDGGGLVSANPLAFLNPNDIESIDILKDAATASIYGAQAANGVVIITTKKGKSGAKTRFDLNVYRGRVEPIRILDVMNTQQFIATRIEAIQNSNPTASAAAVRQSALTGLGFPATISDAEIAALPTYDWQREAYRTGTITNYELSASGGTDKTTFYLSGAYNQQDASLINIDFKRIGGKMNLTHKVNNKLRFETGITASTYTQRGPYGDAGGTTAFGAPQYSAPLILPFNRIYNENGSFFGLPGSGVAMIGDITQNVIASANYTKSKVTTNQFVGNLSAIYNITNDLIFKGFVGLDYRLLKGEFFGDPRLNDYFNIKGFGSVFNNYNTNIITNYTLNYNKTFAEKHNINALVGFEYRQEVNESNSTSAQSYPSPAFSTINAAAEPLSSGGFWTGFKRAGYFTNIKYDYNKKYLLNLTMRYDGSSRFSRNTLYGAFPSVSAGWNINQENFLKDVKFLSDLRLRAGWGTTGNDQIGNFDSRSLYGLGGVYDGAPGISPSGLGNTALKWEKNQTTNIGLDYGFFEGRIKGSIEVYQRVSRDLLLSRSIPATNGFSSITENIGEVVNKGFEFDITTINVDKGGFRWETSFNISLVDNKVTKLFEGVDVLPGNLSVRVGYPLQSNVGSRYAGVNPANGRPMWYDVDGNITYLLRTIDGQQPLGHSGISKVYGGFTNIISFKGFELQALFQYDFGRIVQNTQEFRFADLAGALRNGITYYYDNRWTTPGQITEVPKPANNRTELSGRISSYQSGGRFFQDASYIRLKQLTLSYTLPQTMLSKLKISNLRLYAQAINLLTWTKWTGFDPEFADLGAVNQGVIPQARNYTLGLQLGF
jgi:TonB-linked SusC/RagA family outer membrane protein